MHRCSHHGSFWRLICASISFSFWGCPWHSELWNCCHSGLIPFSRVAVCVCRMCGRDGGNGCGSWSHAVDREQLSQRLYVSVWFCFLSFSALWHASHEGTLSDTQEPSPTVKIQEMVCISYLWFVARFVVQCFLVSHLMLFCYCFHRTVKQFKVAKITLLFSSVPLNRSME